MNKLCGSIGAAALALSGFSAYAEPEQTVNVGVDVQLDIGEASVQGLQDISWKVEVPFEGELGEEAQTFCVFSPTRFFNMTIRGDNKGPAGTSGGFWVQDLAQGNPDLAYLSYEIRVHDIFSGGATPIGSGADGAFQSDVTETGIDSDPFNTDKECTDGENLRLTWSIFFPPSGLPGGGHSNTAVVEQLIDGQLHQFTDLMTVIVEPAL